MVYGICSPYTQDPVDIAYILATHWALYISPIINDWNDYNDREEEYDIPPQAQARLNAIFRQSIGASVQSLYPRLVDSDTWLSHSSTADYNIRFSQADRNTVIQRRKEIQQDDSSLNVTRLPLMGRYLLVASYLASFNPTTMDVRILSQVRDPTKKFRKLGARKVRAGTALKVRCSINTLPSTLWLNPYSSPDWTLTLGTGGVHFRQIVGYIWCPSRGVWARRETSLVQFSYSTRDV